MAYKKDQGRYARLVAFWALFLLVSFGLLGEFRFALNRWLPDSLATPWVDNLPLIGALNLPAVITLALVAVAAFILNRILNRPQIADLLIDTEEEMRKVTWPTSKDTFNGTIAVIVTVVVMLFFLTFSDFAIGAMIKALLSRGAA